MHIKIIVISLLFFSSLLNAAPTTPGTCDVSNLRTEFVGKGIIYGNKGSSGNEHQGEMWLSFDYVCMPWGDRSGMRFGTYNLNNSYGAGVAYRTNTWGTVLQSKLPLTNVAGQNNNIWLKNISANEVGSDGLLRGNLRVELFDLDKNGTVGGGAGGSFPSGTNRNYTIENGFNITFSDVNSGSNTFIVSNYNLATNIRVYDPTCSVSSLSTIDLGEVPLGGDKFQDFKINISCYDSVTIQSKVSTKFSNASSDATKDISGNFLVYDKNGVKVNMSIQDSIGNLVPFDVLYDSPILEPNVSSYDIGFKAKVTPLQDSGYGSFTFVVNYEVEYN